MIPEILRISENKLVYTIMGEIGFSNVIKKLIENASKTKDEKLTEATSKVANVLGGIMLHERTANKILHTIIYNDAETKLSDDFSCIVSTHYMRTKS